MRDVLRRIDVVDLYQPLYDLATYTSRDRHSAVTVKCRENEPKQGRRERQRGREKGHS